MWPAKFNPFCNNGEKPIPNAVQNIYHSMCAYLFVCSYC